MPKSNQWDDNNDTKTNIEKIKSKIKITHGMQKFMSNKFKNNTARDGHTSRSSVTGRLKK